MTRDRLVSVFVVLAAAAVCTVVVWLAWFRPEHSLQTVLMEPTLTPLRDSIREPKETKKHNVASRKGTAGNHGSRPSSTGPLGGSTPQTPSQPKRRAQSRSPARKRQTPARKPAPSPSPQNPPSSPPAPTQTQPAVSVPLPSVCTQQIKVNC